LQPWARLARKPGVQILALVVLTVGAYASAFGNGFVSDDRSSIVAGRAIGSLRNLPQLFLHDCMWNSVGDAFARASAVDTYRPLPVASFFVEHAIYGQHAGGYHADSVLLHVLNVLLVWLLGRRLGLPAAAAVFAAALFATHPSICEAVHWINGRSDPMTMVFLLAGLHLWLPWVGGAKPGWLRVAGICVLTFCASLCKETAFVLAPAGGALALSLLRAQRRSDMASLGRVLALGAPWVAGLALGLVARTLALGRLATGSGSQVGYAVARIPLLWRDGLVSLLLPSAAIRASLFTRYRETSSLSIVLSTGLALALVLAAGWAYRNRRPVLLPWFVLAFLVTLAPVSLLTSFEGWAGWGRYLYPVTPMLALALAEIGALALAGRRPRPWLSAVMACVPVLLAAHTFAAGADFRNERQYNMAQIRDDPTSAIGYLQLGSLERFRGHPAQAIPLLEKGVALDPRSTSGWSLLAWSYLAVGASEPAYRAARTTRALDPDDKVARFVECAVLLQKGQQEEAAAVLLPLLRDDPESKGLWQEAFKAATRFGVDSPFGAAVRLAVRDGRYRPIQAQLEALVAAPPHRPAAE